MSNDFLKPPEELERVAEEISQLRREIQTASSILGRIEKRLKAAFPNYPKQRVRTQAGNDSQMAAPAKNRNELMAIFDLLLNVTKENGDKGFSIEIEKLSDNDLTALAYELGVSDSKRISIKKAREGIRRRVQESLLLSHQPRTNT